jgi:hypothetical protein
MVQVLGALNGWVGKLNLREMPLPLRRLQRFHQ